MREQRRFTLDEANGLLPWLEGKFAELEPYLSEVGSQQERGEGLLTKTRSNGGSSHVQDELHRTQQMVEELQKSVQDILEQIVGRGIIVRSLERGLVDFPSLREGREVHLCWVRGESQVGFWHETDTGFANRQPL